MLREAGFEGDIFTPDEMLRHSVCIDALKKLPVRKYHSNGGPGEVSGAAGVFLPWAEEVRKYPVFKDVWHKRRPAGSGNCLPLPRPLSWSQVDQEHIGQQGGKQMSEKIVQTAGRHSVTLHRSLPTLMMMFSSERTGTMRISISKRGALSPWWRSWRRGSRTAP